MRSRDVERTCRRCGAVFTAPARPHNRVFCDDCRDPARSERRADGKKWANLSEDRKAAAAAASRRWAQANPERVKRSTLAGRLKRWYGLTIEQVEQMHADQGGLCAICQDPIELWHRRTHVDHCHDSKRVRGLLCEDCNRGLGCFKDRVDSLRRAVDYLG